MSIQYWHMQMHPTGEMTEFAPFILETLQQHQFIGLGQWEKGEKTIAQFINVMQIGDVVAIKKGGKLIALVEIISDAYFVAREQDANEKINWIENRRKIKLLAHANNEPTLPHTQGTLTRCTNMKTPTAQIIQAWHHQVLQHTNPRG